MLKHDFFHAAMKAGVYKKLAWTISAFSLTKEDPEAYKQSPYPYRIVADPLGYSFCSPDNPEELIRLDDAAAGKPLFRFLEEAKVTPDTIPNAKEEIITTYGNVLFNWIVMVYAFGGKLPFQKGKVSIGKIESMILQKFEDTPEKEEDRRDDTIYVDEYLKFSEGVYFLTGFSQLCTWSVTKKIMLPPPGIAEYKKKLLEENKGRLHEMSTVAKIDAKLIEYDSEYLKGDPGENFLIDGKSRKVVRKKLYLMNGSETGLSDNNVNATLIENSLHEGWDISKFPDMNNSLRAGSFNRGSETQLGGVSVKWLLRASSNLNVTVEDCGSRMGSVTLVEEDNLNRLVGFSMVTQEGSKRIKSKEEAGAYLGKKLLMRNPMYCKLDKTDYCKVCVGDRLTVNPDGLSLAVSDYGSAFLYIFMAKMHSTQLALAKMDYKKAIF